MRVNKTYQFDENQSMETNLRRLEQDTLQLFLALKGRVRFGSGSDGRQGENVQGEFQVISDTGSADTEFTVAHTVGAVPVGFILIKIDKGGVVYDSGTTWTSTNMYLKCSVANCAITIFLLK